MSGTAYECLKFDCDQPPAQGSYYCAAHTGPDPTRPVVKPPCAAKHCVNLSQGAGKWSLYCAAHAIAAEGGCVMEGHKEVGTKHDQGKLEFHLLPWLAVKVVTSVLMYGARKYSPDGWRKVERPKERYANAAMRHLIAWQCGEKLDPESGLHHLAHAACCVLFLLELDNG